MQTANLTLASQAMMLEEFPVSFPLFSPPIIQTKLNVASKGNFSRLLFSLEAVEALGSSSESGGE